MKVLIITGDLAYPLIRSVVEDANEDVIVHVADTQVAAFLTPNMIIKEVKTHFANQLDEIDLILVPGLIKKGTKEITKELGIPTFKGSTDGADLAMVLNLLDNIELSEDKPADKLIEEEKRKEAFKIIDDFENDSQNIKKLLEKPNNIMIGKLPVGEDFPMRVLAEIANAPFLSKEALINKCQYFVDCGADMIDIGMAAGEDFTDKIPELINTLRPIVGDRPLSIDTLNPKEIQVAAENGIDFMGKVRKPYEENEFLPFPPFMPGKKLSCVEESKEVNIPLKKGTNLLNNLKQSLEQMDLNKNQKQSLLYKIEKRLILSEHHLSVTSVRTEIMEVDGMDYAGKIHMIDAAVKNQDLLELKMPNANGSDYFTIIGLPLNLSKQTSDAVVQIKVQPLNQIENFIVSRISHLRRLKF